jgi:hypothetical protein
MLSRSSISRFLSSSSSEDAVIVGSGTGYLLSSIPNYSVHTWSSSTGTLNVSESGYADILLVGGGGSGRSPDRIGGSQGGAGSVMEMRVLLLTGIYTVTVGAGATGGEGLSGAASSILKRPNSRYFANEIFRITAPGGAGGSSENTPGTQDFGGDSGDGYIHNNGSGGAVGTGAGAGGYNAYGGLRSNGTTGAWSNITGTDIQYGQAGGPATAAGPTGTPGTSGNGGSFGGNPVGLFLGNSGIVVVRVSS